MGKTLFAVILMVNTALPQSPLAAIHHLYYTPTFKTDVLHFVSSVQGLK